jgi:hypothetical protein
VRSNSDPHDIVTSIPFDLLGVEDVTKIMLFLLSVLTVMAGEVTHRGLVSWFNTHLREAVGRPVSPLSIPPSTVNTNNVYVQVNIASNHVLWLLDDISMKLLVHQGFGFDLTINQLAVTQNLYMFYMFYTTSPLVLNVSLFECNATLPVSQFSTCRALCTN